MKKTLTALLTALLLTQSLACGPAQALTFGSFLVDDVPAPTFSADPADESAIPESKLREDGRLRVYLQSLDDPAAMDITLNGAYTADHDAGFRFDEGTRITLRGGESVHLYVGGLTVDMGSTFTLTRCGSEDGLYIEGSEKGNLYAGDLTLSLNEEGGLRPILHIDIEDYLLGVVPYEMNDAWPLEALKAQAVAARTYAMQRRSVSADRDYDLVDTTADQVYKGCDPQNANAARAVAETCGVVGTTEDGFPVCWYTASNGGETALPSDVWEDSEDPAYLARHADPYDLANPLSIVHSIAFDRKADGCEALRKMLQAGLDAIAAEQGREAEEPEFESILSVRAADPVAAGSIMCNSLRFGVSATGLKPSSEGSDAADKTVSVFSFLSEFGKKKETERVPLNEVFEITLSVYDQIKDGLGLAIDGGDYEIASVQEKEDGFVISLRRFGHGVGMSQRGAQNMAGSCGMRFTDILAFYYPGMALERIEWDRSVESPASDDEALPEPEDGERYARVEASSLNVREAPSTESGIVDCLDRGARLIVSGEADAEGWVRVHTAKLSGYVRLQYLKVE